MSSPLLALFIRSLREDSRQNLTYFARSGLALIILLFQFTTHANLGGANAPGLMFFTTVIVIDFCFVILAGVSYFSSAISEEKEEMTLGLLRMTNLNPLSILLGKSTSRLCAAILLFAAQIPFTLLAITLGGISLHQVFAAYVAVAAFLVLVSNLALLGSVICRRSSGAALFTGVTLFLFFAFVPIANFLAQLPAQLGAPQLVEWWAGALEVIATFVHEISPFSRLVIFRTGFAEPAFSFQVWSNLAFGAVFFGLAWVLFERFCAEQKEAGPTRSGVARARGGRRFLSPGRTWQHRALAWKDFYFLGGGKLWVFIKLLIYGAPLLFTRLLPQRFGGPPSWDDFGLVMFWLMMGFIAVELAFAAANVFRAERQGQTLSSLAMLPQGLRRVAYDKLLGIVPSLFAAGFYLLLSLPLISEFIAELFNQFRFSRDWVGLVAFIFVFAQGIFFLHLVANLSLRVKRGALPLAIGVYFLLSIFIGISSIGLLRDESGMFLLLILTIGATIFLHLNTGQRLIEIAAEE